MKIENILWTHNYICNGLKAFSTVQVFLACPDIPTNPRE